VILTLQDARHAETAIRFGSALNGALEIGAIGQALKLTVSDDGREPQVSSLTRLVATKDVPAADERSSCAVDEEQTLMKRWEAWPPSTRREAMLEQFLTLPEVEAPEAAPKVSKAPRFQAQHPREAASAHLGATQQERTAELHKAAAAGDRFRLLALFEAGVDVDAVNEYGQSPVFLAAYHDAAEAVSLLAWAGADIDRPANGGSSAWACAAAIGHEGAARALVEAGARTVPVQRSAFVGSEPDPSFHWLIPLDSDAAGAGSCILDDALAEDFLCQVDHLFESLPVAARTKSCSSDRSYYCDSEGWIQEAFKSAFLAAQEKHRALVDLELEVTMPHMRFLHYADVGGGLPPHLDLVRTDEKGRRSTHTFILYLSDCSGGGGETVLLHHMEDNAEAVLVAVEPRRGRLLLFPHLCPHLARPTVVVPKLLLRGEIPVVASRLQSATSGVELLRWRGLFVYECIEAGNNGGNMEACSPCEQLRLLPMTWRKQFTHQEIWVMNTAYCLYASDGPQVALEATFRGRLDEMAKCLAVSPADAAVRLFWADAVISVEGDDLSTWMRFLTKRAPSEQQTCQFLWPNIVAAGEGRRACRGVEEAIESWTADAEAEQPTPGIDVWKPKIAEELLQRELEESWFEWPRQPTAESAHHFLKKLQMRWSRDTNGESRPSVVGMLLDIDGATLKPYCASPLSPPARHVSDPEVCVTILGGPKGISPGFKACLQDVFGTLAVPLLKVRLGPEEEMAHACLAYLRLQDDAGLLKAAVTDLLRLGPSRYASLVASSERALYSLARRLHLVQKAFE
ncbi:ASB2, partial [Symbiodinium sp. CCMP2456]